MVLHGGVLIRHLSVSIADGGVGVAGADAAHGGVATRRAPFARDGRFRVGFT